MIRQSKELGVLSMNELRYLGYFLKIYFLNCMEYSVPRGEMTDADLTIDEAEGEVLKRKCSQLEMPA